jgi:hypothetical protein
MWRVIKDSLGWDIFRRSNFGVVAIRSQYFGEVPTDAGTGPGNQNRLVIVCDDGLSEATGSELFALLWAAELPATEKKYLYANSQECDMIN